MASMVAVMGVVLAAQVGVAFAAKVNPSSASTNVTEGQSFDVTFTLDSPIIDPPSSTDPDVTLTFTPDDPSRLSFSPSTLQWTPSQWFQTRTVHLTSFTAVITYLDPASTTTAVPTTVAPTTVAPTLVARTSTTLVVVYPMPGRLVTTTTVPPTTAIAVAPAHDSLPATGAPIETVFIGGAIAVASGVALARPNRARGRRRRPR